MWVDLEAGSMVWKRQDIKEHRTFLSLGHDLEKYAAFL